MIQAQKQALTAALRWHIDAGADEALSDKPGDVARPAVKPPPAIQTADAPRPPQNFTPAAQAVPEKEDVAGGTHELKRKTQELARSAATLEDLCAAITAFDGLDIKRTATNMVFCDGNPRAPVMLVGEAPGADEDRMGRPFVGVSGRLLDRILKCIDLDRAEEDPGKAIYISNILNWRPPGNRTPTPAEVDVCLPFIERHIILAQPKILILCGGVSAKALLGVDSSISRLRGKWHGYTPRTEGVVAHAAPIPAIATYHPAYLLRTPLQKKAVWQDMLIIQEKRREMKLIDL